VAVLLQFFCQFTVIVICFAPIRADELSNGFGDLVLDTRAKPAKAESCLVLPSSNISVFYIPKDYWNGVMRPRTINFFGPQQTWPFWAVTASADYNHYCTNIGFLIVRDDWGFIHSNAVISESNEIKAITYLKYDSRHPTSVVENIINGNPAAACQRQKGQIRVNYTKLNFPNKNI